MVPCARERLRFARQLMRGPWACARERFVCEGRVQQAARMCCSRTLCAVYSMKKECLLQHARAPNTCAGHPTQCTRIECCLLHNSGCALTAAQVQQPSPRRIPTHVRSSSGAAIAPGVRAQRSRALVPLRPISCAGWVALCKPSAGRACKPWRVRADGAGFVPREAEEESREPVLPPLAARELCAPLHIHFKLCEFGREGSQLAAARPNSLCSANFAPRHCN
jgi:hypothetical protein